MGVDARDGWESECAAGGKLFGQLRRHATRTTPFAQRGIWAERREMSGKRGSQFNHYGSEGGQPFHKKQRANDQHHSNGPHQPQYTGSKASRENPALQKINTLPDPEYCQPCKLAATEMQTGLISLLDQLVQEEGGLDGDEAILKHAEELHRLLLARGNSALPSKPRRDLNDKVPDTEAYANFPPYVFDKIKESSNLPPLPPITNPTLQEAVFTHRSVQNGVAPKGARASQFNYEQLEFLGDAYIEIIASRLIYSRFPHIETGTQTQLRESLVKNDTLSGFANKYGLGDRLAHIGHMKGEKGWAKITADVFEAYVAALVQSDTAHGFETAEKWLTELWAPQLLAYEPPMLQKPDARRDLDNLVNSKGVKLDFRNERPMTVVKGVQRYFQAVYLTGWGYQDRLLGRGEGQNMKIANIEAAADALERSKDIVEECWAKKVERRKEIDKEREEKEKLGEANGDGAKSKDANGEENKDVDGEKKKNKKKSKKKRDSEVEGS
ncbi:ribonuclease III [Polyplosphaeria fusca]|uniref:Ribonuclease III n=1 Tax=Polyplosphaeria fusca TaxID=682080 RepID=A0A9P4UVU3_9PLEO|nr:ribonuclease III [Polyplosphaeria fusca]